MMKLSIVIPVYNAEMYISDCLESIFRQGLSNDDFEVIIINDGSTDNSMKAIADIADRHPNIRVTTQPNSGASVARNHGIAQTTGTYVMFVDADDLLIEQQLPLILKTALDTEADIIIADFLRMNDQKIKQSQFPTPLTTCNSKEQTGVAYLMKDLNPRECYIWNKLYRRSFLTDNRITFEPGICYEDIPFTYECLLKAQRCIHVPVPIYIYRMWHASVTTTFNKKKGTDLCTAIARLWQISKQEDLPPAVAKRLRDNTFTTFSLLLYNVSHEISNTKEQKDILAYLKEQAPDLRFTNGVKQRLTFFLYENMPGVYLSIRNLYGRIVEDIKK